MRIKNTVKARLLIVVVLVALVVSSASAAPTPQSPEAPIGKATYISQGAFVCRSASPCPDKESFEQVQEDLYKGNYIKTDTIPPTNPRDPLDAVKIEFSVHDSGGNITADCSTGVNSLLQVRPDDPALLIKWFSTGIAQPEGISWCDRSSGGSPRQAYGVNCTTVECKTVLLVEGTIFGVVLGADGDVIKVVKGSVTVAVAGTPTPLRIEADKELFIPPEGSPEERLIQLSDEDRSIINLLMRR
jgi:hypothetical protein